MFILTGVEITDGNPFVWIEGVFSSRESAREAINATKKAYEEDYGESPEEAGVEFEIHEVEV